MLGVIPRDHLPICAVRRAGCFLMAEQQTNLPSFRSPPVIETVLGVQFAPIPDLTGAHIGWFWKNFLDGSWARVIEVPFLQDQFERFAEQNTWNFPQLQFSVSLPNRLQMIHADDDRVIQVQNTRFLYNWRRRADAYPRYKNIYPQFASSLKTFESFLSTAGLGDISPNQWEITYINHIPQGSLWKSPDDWHKVFPGLFNLPGHPDPLRLESISNDWHLEIVPQRGRLHIACKHGKSQDRSGEVLVLEFTARGPIDGGETGKAIESGLHLGRRIIVETFVALASDSALKYWEVE
jgi:uncharacterized protein (TIGR04255 family)